MGERVVNKAAAEAIEEEKNISIILIAVSAT